MFKNKLPVLLAAAVVAVALLPVNMQAQAEAAAVGQVVTKNGTYPTVQANPANFTGSVRTESLFRPHGASKTYAGSVTFEPGSRTNWHIHATGQSLIVTGGYGYTQEWGQPMTVLQPGDIVWCPPGVKHWHGAGPTTAMTHIAISEASSKGVTWLEPVSDEQYSSIKEGSGKNV